MASGSTPVTFDTGHEEMIHDAQLDYYGKRLATASSDRTIKLFDVAGSKQTFLTELRRHDGPVWQVSWAHPKFGNLLASCSYDGRTVVWKETSPNVWAVVFEDVSSSSVNSVAWAPHTFGLVLAAACADGTVSVFVYRDGAWDGKKAKTMAHKAGCNSVSWGPDMKTGSLLSNQALDQAGAYSAPMRFVTAGCDNMFKIWRFDGERIDEETKCFAPGTNKHADWVRDAAWAPSLGLPCNTIATCSEDKTVAIWTENVDGTWKKADELKFDFKVWRVSWSVMGNILAVSQGDNKVSLWKEAVDGKWKNLSKINETLSQAADAKDAKSP